MYSAKNELRVRPQMFSMNNTVIGNCSPQFLVPEPPTFRVKRMVEMENELVTTLSAKKNPNNRKMPASARKFSTAKKPLGLSQNMSTSKKLTNAKRASNIGAKRSINFSTYIKNEYPQLGSYKNDARQSVVPNTDKKKSVNNHFAVSTERFSISNKDEMKCGNSILKKTPKSVVKQDRKSVMQTPSDIDISPYPYLYNNPAILINTQKVSDDATDSDDASVDNELKGLVENNSKILTELMRLLTTLLENNNKLNDLIDKNKTKREISKSKEVTVFKELFPLQSDSDKENSTNVEYYAKPNNCLRKAAILNSEIKKNATVTIMSPKKKSMQMYAELKSNMKFLNTPRKDGKSYNIESQTPNTRGRAMLSANIQDQLKLLYDSPTD